MPVYRASGIVLRRISLGETDRIITVLTPELGKVSAVAKGARRPGSRFSGATELFTNLRLLLAKGRTIDIVSQCEIRDSFPAIRADLELLARATYLCELVDRLLADREPNQEVHDLLLAALYLLQRTRSNPDVIVHSFELRLMSERGYAPHLDSCVTCDGPLAAGRYAFSPTAGGLLCASCRWPDDAVRIHPPSLRLFRTLLDADTEELVLLAQTDIQTAEVARCMHWYIRYHLDQDLKSAEFLDMLRRQ